MLSQVFLTGRIAEKFGVKALITFVPVIMIFAFAGLALSGAFAVLTMVVIGRRAMEYAFVRPGREMLWSPLDKETKYKAKNTVDVPVYRGADALSAQLNNWVAGAGFGIAAVAWLGAAVAALWGLLGLLVGSSLRRQRKVTGRRQRRPRSDKPRWQPIGRERFTVRPRSDPQLTFPWGESGRTACCHIRE